MTTRNLSIEVLSIDELVKAMPKVASTTLAVQKQQHQVMLSAASYIVGDDDAARDKACAAVLEFLNTLGTRNKTARAARAWLTTHFRIGVEFTAKGYTKIRFKPNSEKADDFASADAMPFWLGEAKPSNEEDEANRTGVAEVRAEFARFIKKMDAINNGSATDAAKKLARKARNFVAEC